MPQPVVKYSDEELIDLVKAEGTLSDWRKAAAITATEVEESVASDPDEDDMTMSWKTPRASCHNTGKSRQSRINRMNELASLFQSLEVARQRLRFRMCTQLSV